MARKTKEEALKTRESIIDAAVRVLAEKGIPQTTLNDIAREAGVTRGAIYWHFKNKADLLEVLWDDLFSPFEAVRNQDEDAAADLDPLEILHKAHLDLFRGLEDNPRRLQMLNIFFASETAEESAQEMHADQFCEGQEIIGKVLTRAVHRGQLPETFDVRLGTLAIMSFIYGLLRKWTKHPDQFRADREIPALLEGLMNMLRSSFAGKEQS